MQGQPVDEEENEPRWMQGEVIDEGVPESLGEVLPPWLNRTAEERASLPKTRAERYIAGYGRKTPEQIEAENARKTGRLMSGGIGFAEAITGGNFSEIEGTKAAYPSYAGGPMGSTMVVEGLDRMGLLPKASGGGRTEQANQFEAGFEQRQAKAAADNPLSYMGGQLPGYFAPGAAMWNAGKASTMAIPGVQQLANVVGRSGRIPSWLGRIAGSIGALGADAAVYGATVGASDQQAMTGEKQSLGDRAKMAKDFAFASVGEAAEASGVDVPDWAKPIPINAILPFVGSAGERSVKGISTGGKTITPDRVQATAINNLGRAPSPNSTATAMADVLPAERVTSGSVKTFRFVENALRNGLKDAGLSPAEITGRVTRGFNSIKQSLPALADGSTTLAQLIEREFADAGPQVSENLRLFLLRVGLDDPAVTRGVIQEMRTGQVEDFRKVVNENLGSQRQYDVEQGLKQGLTKIGEAYEQILGRAKELGNNSPLADSLREELLGSKFKFELLTVAKKAGWKDVDTFIQQDPWSAAHKLKSKLLSEARAAKKSGNYEKYQEPATYLREMLNELPGYEDLSRQFAKESGVLDTLGHVDTLPNGQQVKAEGFGPNLRKASGKETEVLRASDQYAAMPDRKQQAAQISTGQVLKDQLRTARPGGTDLQGQDVMGLRLLDLQNEGMMSASSDMPGALPAVFGEAGERISGKVDDIVNSRRFLADIDPSTGSNTVNKANAQMAGDSVVTSGLPRQMTSGYTQSGLIDATMLASGLPPVATMLTKGIPALGKVLGPGRGTRAEIARALMQRPARRGPPPMPPEPIKPMTGRNRPRKWRKDPKWSDPVLTNPQIGPPKPEDLKGFKAKRAADAAAIAAVGANLGGKADAQEADYSVELESANARVSELEMNQIPALEADLQRLTDPDLPPKELQGILQARGFDLGPYGIDGKVGEATKQARKDNIQQIRSEIEFLRGELSTARAHHADIRRKQTYAETAGNPAMGWAQKGLEGAGLLGGLWLGNRLRRGAVNKSSVAAKSVERKANKLINQDPISRAQTGPNSVNTRAGNVNEFWRMGGAENNYPFKTLQSSGEWRNRPNTADSSALFPPPKRFDAKDAAIIGGGAVDAAGFEILRYNAQAKLEEVEAEIERYRDDPNAEAELRRALEEQQQLEAFIAFYTTASRVGGGVAAGRALGAFKQPYARPRPNIGAAETEQALIRQHIAKKKVKPPANPD
jgi:hypothetical protein